MTDNNEMQTPGCINSEELFKEVERQRKMGELTKAIRETHANGPVYGIEPERYGKKIMAYYPDGSIRPLQTHTEEAAKQ